MKILLIFSLLLLPLSLSAQIRYTDIEPDTLIADTNDIPGQYQLDLDGDGYSDYFVMHIFYPVPVYVLSLHTEFSTIHEMLLDADNKVVALQKDAIISDTSKNWVCSAAGGQSAGISFSRAWFGTGDHYVGLRVRSEGEWHYGWLRAEIAPDESSIILKDYAVETSGGKTMHAGATGIESAGSPARPRGMEIAVEGRYVRVGLPPGTTAQLSVHDIIGRAMHRRSVEGTRMTLDLSDLPRGLYFLRVTTPQETVVQRLAFLR